MLLEHLQGSRLRFPLRRQPVLRRLLPSAKVVPLHPMRGLH